jgi:hypothetical protein
MKSQPYKDGEWTIYPGKITLKIISGGVMPEPADYHDPIRWRRIVKFLVIVIPAMAIAKWMMS